MIVLICGASHTGKTAAAQKLTDEYKIPYLCLDHLKMGLIRSGNTPLTVCDDEKLTAYLWNIAKEIIKTAIENGQHLIIEGCYIPFDWKKDFSRNYLREIKYYCLIMSENYIEANYSDIIKLENVIEKRLGKGIEKDTLIEDNARNLRGCVEHGLDYILIDGVYDVNIRLDLLKLRKYRDEDFEEISALFAGSVRTVCSDDYSQSQTEAWIKNSDSLDKCRQRLKEQNTLTAEINGKIAGFGSVDQNGCIDLLYVHKDFQRRGVASALCDELERGFARITVYASKTAKPFFENRGYDIVRENEVDCGGVKLKNFLMRKTSK